MIFSRSTQVAPITETKQHKSRKFLCKTSERKRSCNQMQPRLRNSQIWVKDLSRNTFALQQDKSRGGVGE